jgi:hypothetical protein
VVLRQAVDKGIVDNERMKADARLATVSDSGEYRQLVRPRLANR